MVGGEQPLVGGEWPPVITAIRIVARAERSLYKTTAAIRTVVMTGRCSYATTAIRISAKGGTLTLRDINAVVYNGNGCSLQLHQYGDT